MLAGGPALVIDSISMSADSRNIFIQAERLRNFDQFFIGDTTSVRIGIKEDIDILGYRFPARHPATVTAIHVVDPKEIERLGLRLTCIIDLTLDYPLVERQRHALSDISGMFRPENLQLRFITDEGLSDPFSCTDYIINSHIIPTGTGYKQLYRNLLTAFTELRGECDAIILMSDGKVYDEDLAMDDEHYVLQERLYDLCTRSDRVSTWPQFFYFNLNPAPIGDQNAVTTLAHESESILQLLADYTGGTVTYDFEGFAVMSRLLQRHGITFGSIDLTLTNPDQKIFVGSTHEYTVELRDAKTDSLLASASHEMTIGGLVHPITIVPTSLHIVLLRGIFMTLFLLLMLYLVIQFILPWCRFRWFQRQYMGRYHGLNTYIGDHIIEGQCYYCKGAFAPGDEIVAACKHTMHRECWEANEYRCPEHGHTAQCAHSHHYYNAGNLLDTRNGHYCLEWLLWSTLACFLLWGISFQRVIEFTYIQLPPFVLTLLFSLLSRQHSHRFHAVFYLLVRGVAASLLVAAGDYALYNITLWLSLPTLTYVSYVLYGVIVTLSVTVCSTWHTLTPLDSRRLAIGLLATLLLFIAIMAYILYNERENQQLMLILHIVTGWIACGILCHPRHRSFHYFLHMEGPTKPTDIALYKWFKANPSAVVSIGHSVDCQLQLVWDLQAYIAPVQAQIVCQGGCHYLRPVEEGVYDGKGHPLTVDRYYRLYHGRRFVIGRCQFTYIEKDQKS